jgi:predicted ABC-type ATPase
MRPPPSSVGSPSSAPVESVARRAKRRGRIYVLAGTNGAGKSSIGGEALREAGVEFFNPDEAARRIRAAQPGLTQTEVNSAAWHHGRRLLENAIADHLDFAFETTLGGETMTRLLEGASDAGLEVRVWYAALESPERHIERVRRRVAKGGHDIPEADIRRRYDQSRLNLIRLLPKLAELRVYDNSKEGDPDAGVEPAPRLVLHWRSGRIVAPRDLAPTPDWAKPIVAAAMKLARRR